MNHQHIEIQISLKFVPRVPINIEGELARVVAWHQTGDKAPMMTQFTDSHTWLGINGWSRFWLFIDIVRFDGIVQVRLCFSAASANPGSHESAPGFLRHQFRPINQVQ